jgi:hypothetical protein
MCELKFEICIWNVWNLKIWRLKCLNWGVWILKAENWNLKFRISMWSVWNLKFWKLKYLNLDVWTLEVANWNVWSKHVVHTGKEHNNIVCSHKHHHKVTICFEPLKTKVKLEYSDMVVAHIG